jgi:hypothetical protein
MAQKFKMLLTMCRLKDNIKMKLNEIGYSIAFAYKGSVTSCCGNGTEHSVSAERGQIT